MAQSARHQKLHLPFPPSDKVLNQEEYVMVSNRRTCGNRGFLEAVVLSSHLWYDYSLECCGMLVMSPV